MRLAFLIFVVRHAYKCTFACWDKPQGNFYFANIKTKSDSPITPPQFSRSLTIFLYKRQCNRDCFLSETVKLPEPTPILLYAFFDRKTLQPFICYAICLFLRRLPLNSWACKPFSNEGFIYMHLWRRLGIAQASLTSALALHKRSFTTDVLFTFSAALGIALFKPHYPQDSFHFQQDNFHYQQDNFSAHIR